VIFSQKFWKVGQPARGLAIQTPPWAELRVCGAEILARLASSSQWKFGFNIGRAGIGEPLMTAHSVSSALRSETLQKYRLEAPK
jgi:hypothetical protein